MLGRQFSWVRTALLAMSGLLLASGAAWAHGGGHGGGHGGMGHAYAGMHHGGVGYGGYYHHGLGYGVGHGYYGYGSIYPYYGLGFGRGYGYGMTYGGYGLGYGLGYPYYGYGFSYGGSYPYYGGTYYYGGSYPSYGAYNYGAVPYASGSAGGYYTPYLGSYSSSYPPTAQQQAPPQDGKAHLLVIVPENAELLFNGNKTTRTGPQREFLSPELTPGKHYSYDIKARWTENGKPVEQERTVQVQGNTWQTIDFTRPKATADKTK